MKIVFFLLLPLWLFASQILNYNVYDRTDRVDLMLTFDTPFEGVISQQRQLGSILVKLSDISIESPKIKTLNSKFLSKITITPIDSHVQILARVPNQITMQASKTSDAYGLRLRFLKKAATAKSTMVNENGSLASLPTKQDNALEDNYMMVVIILIIGIIILMWLKYSMSNTKNNAQKSSLFKSKRAETGSLTEATIRFQKPLDQTNSVMMLDYADESYLVIIGNNNVVLDKFHDSKPVTQGEFESMLNNKEEELESYLQLDKIDKVEANEVLERYKERASV